MAPRKKATAKKAVRKRKVKGIKSPFLVKGMSPEEEKEYKVVSKQFEDILRNKKDGIACAIEIAIDATGYSLKGGAALTTQNKVKQLD